MVLHDEVNAPVLSAPQQKSFIDEEYLEFPRIFGPPSELAKNDDPDMLRKWVEEQRHALVDQVHRYGAVVLRGFAGLKRAKDFDMVVEAVGLAPLPYVGGAAPRTSVVGQVFTTNESPPEAVIPFHHEMAQVKKFPKHIWFFCETPPQNGGETPLLLSHVVASRMEAKFPEFCARLENEGVRYKRVMPFESDLESPIGRGWKDTYHTVDRSEVERKCADLKIDIRWLDDDENCLETITQPLPAIRIDPRSGKKVYFNSMVAAYVGWQDSRNEARRSVTHANGDALDEEVMEYCSNLMQEVCVDLPWQAGDLFIIDNMQCMHARRPFTPPRVILAALSEE